MEVSHLNNFNYSGWPLLTRKCSENDYGLDFIKGKHSANMSCNNVCLSNFIYINLFCISIVCKCNSGDHFGIHIGCRMAKSSVINMKQNYIWTNDNMLAMGYLWLICTPPPTSQRKYVFWSPGIY